MAGVRAKGGKKARKYGRNQKWCQTYKAMGREESNRRRRIARHERRMAKKVKKLRRRARRKAAQPHNLAQVGE